MNKKFNNKKLLPVIGVIAAIALMLMQSLVLAVFLGVTSQGGISAAESGSEVDRSCCRTRKVILDITASGAL